MNGNELTNGQASLRGSGRRPLGTRGGSIVEYILIAGFVALAAIYGFRQARGRENRVLAYQARVIRTLDITAPGEADFRDPAFGEDYGAPICNANFCTRPGQCFAKGTLVAAEKGLVPIESLREGDLIWSRDEATGDFALRPVLHRFVTPGRQVLDLNIATPDGVETIRATTGHPIWAAGKGWVSAAELAVNQELFSASGDALHVAPPSNTEINTETVYNFEIAEFHTYFVGRHGLWVHNATAPTGPGPEVPPCQKGGATGPKDPKEPPKPETIEFARGAKYTDKGKQKDFPLGGSYNQIKNARTKNAEQNNGVNVGGEIHHIPQQAIWRDYTPKADRPFTPGTGPAIWMEKADHAATMSNGQSDGDHEAWKRQQEALVKDGQICQAIQNDIDDVRNAAGKASKDRTKYDDGIRQMIAYVNGEGKQDCPNLH